MILLLFVSLLLGFSISQAQTEEKRNTQTNITWYELGEAQKLAMENDKKVLVFAEASWCSFCKKMKREVFPDTNIKAETSKHFYPVKIDIESEEKVTFNGNEMTQRQFSKHMNVSATPTFFFLEGDGSIIGTKPGYVKKDVYQTLLTYVGTEAYNQIEFEEYLNQKE